MWLPEDFSDFLAENRTRQTPSPWQCTVMYTEISAYDCKHIRFWKCWLQFPSLPWLTIMCSGIYRCSLHSYHYHKSKGFLFSLLVTSKLGQAQNPGGEWCAEYKKTLFCSDGNACYRGEIHVLLVTGWCMVSCLMYVNLFVVVVHLRYMDGVGMKFLIKQRCVYTICWRNFNQSKFSHWLLSVESWFFDPLIEFFILLMILINAISWFLSKIKFREICNFGLLQKFI